MISQLVLGATNTLKNDLNPVNCFNNEQMEKHRELFTFYNTTTSPLNVCKYICFKAIDRDHCFHFQAKVEVQLSRCRSEPLHQNYQHMAVPAILWHHAYEQEVDSTVLKYIKHLQNHRFRLQDIQHIQHMNRF